MINRPAIATVFAYFLLNLHFCVIYFILHPGVFRASRLNYFCSFSYSFGVTDFDDFQFVCFLHLNIL